MHLSVSLGREILDVFNGGFGYPSGLDTCRN